MTVSTVPFFFILGRPRSGTTLVRMLFDAHPNVIIPPEFPIIPLVITKFRRVSYWNESLIESFISTIYENHTFGHRTIGQLKIDREALTRNLKSLAGNCSLGDLLIRFNAHSGSSFPKSEIRIAGDKNPIYSVCINWLLEIFPSAKFICLVRDYRDIFVSLVTMNGKPFEAPNLCLQVARWNYVSRQFLKYRKKYSGKFFLIRYEDLVAQPESSVKKLTAFLGIPFDPKVFDFYQSRDQIIQTYSPENIRSFHSHLITPINTGRINMWQGKLTENQVRMADQLAGKAAGLLGYKRQNRRFDLFLFLRSRPMVWYGFLLFKMLTIGIHFPYPVIRWMAFRVRKLVKVYGAVTSNRFTR